MGGSGDGFKVILDLAYFSEGIFNDFCDFDFLDVIDMSSLTMMNDFWLALDLFVPETPY